MTIIFPMAGMSSRFTKAGYDKPKYMLKVDDKSVFYYAISSFKNYFESCNFLFIYRDIQDTKTFIENECKQMGLNHYESIFLDAPTNGQAETVYLGLLKSQCDVNESILVFNIDTFRPNFQLPSELDFNNIDGYLEVFEAEGDHWSFVLPEGSTSDKVKKTTEKERISSLCSSGLYYFKRAGDFIDIFEMLQKNDIRTKNEYYIAPMYNYLIEQGKDIRYSIIDLDEIIFCGTPQEYEVLQNKNEKGFGQ